MVLLDRVSGVLGFRVLEMMDFGQAHKDFLGVEYCYRFWKGVTC